MKSDQYRTSVLSVAEMYQADELALQHVKSSYCLMQHAASAVVDFVQTLVFPGNSKPYVLLLCGKGNNGGDGLLAAQILTQHGYHVKTIFCGEQNDTDALTGDAGKAFDAFTKAGMSKNIGVRSLNNGVRS
jgi:NAD(P)H-hydrate epimerase